MSTSQDHDYLTSLPMELLIKILAEVPMDSYLDLTHTSKGLRDFMKANAADICNEAIRSRYSIVAEYFKAELKSGWLVSTHQRYDKWDEDYVESSVNYYGQTSVYKYNYHSLLGKLYNSDPHSYAENLRTKIINISFPGPQFLHFLERNNLIVCDEHRLPNCCSVRYDELTEWEQSCFHRDYELFLYAFNSLELEVKNGKLVAVDEKKIPREMLWYYGLDNLVLIA